MVTSQVECEQDLREQAALWFPAVEKILATSGRKNAPSPAGVALAKTYQIVSLFAGCGGMDLGFVGGFTFGGKTYRRLPFNLLWVNEFQPAFADIYEANMAHAVVRGDIRELLEDIPPKSDILIGGFPCQDFSHAGKRRGFRSERGRLYRAMVEAVKRSKPRVFVAENVRGLMTTEGALETIKADFEALGYHVKHWLVSAHHFGVPQTRQRVLIIGFETQSMASKFNVPKPKNSGWMTTKDAIHDLIALNSNEVDGHTWTQTRRNGGSQGQSAMPENAPARTIRAEHHGNIEFHYALERRLSVRECARIQSFPDNFKFGLVSQTAAYKAIGNAVPPVMAWHFAKSLLEVL